MSIRIKALDLSDHLCRHCVVVVCYCPHESLPYSGFVTVYMSNDVYMYVTYFIHLCTFLPVMYLVLQLQLSASFQ